uniref:aromatic amino acid lyase n=1 Tax=Staphylococcus aureus TaxID=1280 RepID=UPI0016435E3B
AQHSAYQSESIPALTHHSLNPIIHPYPHHLHPLRNFQQQINLTPRIRHSLRPSTLTTPQPQIPLQHPYTFPSIPQIHPPTFQLFNYVKQQLQFQI